MHTCAGAVFVDGRVKSGHDGRKLKHMGKPLVTVRTLMIDVDGVVIRHPDGLRWDHAIEADLGVDPAEFQSAFFADHWTDVVNGRADLHERLAIALPDFAPHLTPEALTDYWFSKDAHLDQGFLDQLAALNGRYALHLATVQEHLRAAYLWNELGLKDRFAEIHYAAAYGCGKPDPAFFDAVAARTGHGPHELLLIDDSPRNVEAARACGWRAGLWDGTRTVADVIAEALGR
ncbi:MAG: HAD family hydrolase [Phenylobacterium sp.]|uniref:HAD family hydrolase n=1 Tax=Phenylobacterium sp. TaxID=1871053 RepID=UPI002735B34E|nr:HAD family hydrolase [Phenylobacterium sp.]MDP1643260.1 HAD family hydrolase [Phenylobacterium sp.]MDP3118528.1 HAD family hydrolase [Phenylobacterium sp.]